MHFSLVPCPANSPGVLAPAALFRHNACRLVCVADIWTRTKADTTVPSRGRPFVILTFLILHHHKVIRMLVIPILQCSLSDTLDRTATHSPRVGDALKVGAPGSQDARYSFETNFILFQHFQKCCFPFNMFSYSFLERVWPRLLFF